MKVMIGMKIKIINKFLTNFAICLVLVLVSITPTSKCFDISNVQRNKNLKQFQNTSRQFLDHSCHIVYYFISV